MRIFLFSPSYDHAMSLIVFRQNLVLIGKASGRKLRVRTFLVVSSTIFAASLVVMLNLSAVPGSVEIDVETGVFFVASRDSEEGDVVVDSVGVVVGMLNHRQHRVLNLGTLNKREKEEN